MDSLYVIPIAVLLVLAFAGTILLFFPDSVHKKLPGWVFVLPGHLIAGLIFRNRLKTKRVDPEVAFASTEEFAKIKRFEGSLGFVREVEQVEGGFILKGKTPKEPKWPVWPYALNLLVGLIVSFPGNPIHRLIQGL